MPKQTFTINDFSGGANGYVDPLDVADNELAQCQGFKIEPGVVSVLGDMKGAYIPPSANSSDSISIEAGYGIFALAHDYDKDGDLNTTKYLVLMDGITFDIYDDDGDEWQASQLTLGTVASDASFAGNIKPCFFIAEGALRISPGNFTAKDNGAQTAAEVTGTAYVGAYHTIATDATASNHVTVGDTIVISEEEMVVIDIPSTTSIAITRAVTGSFLGMPIADDATIYSVLETRWRGVVKRRNFPQAGSRGTFTEWYSTYAHPRPPANYNTSIDNGDVLTQYTFPFLVDNTDQDSTPVDGTLGPRVTITHALAANTDATWDGAKILLYCTALYDDIKQESQPKLVTTSSVTITAGNQIGMGVIIAYSDAATSSDTDGVDTRNTYLINKRVTGARVYYEDIDNEPGSLYQLLEIDFNEGCKSVNAERFTSWVSKVDNECVASHTNAHDVSTLIGTDAFVFVHPPKAITYEFNTGYPPDTNTHARYKTAVIAGNRLYAGNIYQSGKAEGDRMISSPIYRYDILPEIEPHVIRVSAGDGDEIIKLEAYSDRILQFKKRTLYIVNIGGGLGEEFLESQHKNMGVENPSQTCMTEYGVAWVNSSGVFLYDGQEITDLTMNKLQMTNATDRPRALNVTESNIPLIGYHPDNKWLVVHPQSAITDVNNVEAWIHDFKNGSWTYSKELTLTGYHKSNMIWTPDNNLVFATGTNSSFNPLFYKYQDSTSCNSATFGVATKLLLLTKEFHLSAPGVKKKLRSVYITYSASANSYIEADLIYKHSTGSTTDDLEEAASGSTYYTEALGFKSTSGAVRTVELVPTTYLTNAYTFQLKLHNPDAAYPEGADFKLYNISFVYRPLGVR